MDGIRQEIAEEEDMDTYECEKYVKIISNIFLNYTVVLMENIPTLFSTHLSKNI